MTMNRDQYILWMLKPAVPKPLKVPVDINGDPINPYSPDYWMDEATAKAVASVSEFGYGFVFTDNDPYFFVDIDHALQADNTWSPLANELVAAFPGAYVEVSQSGTGMHIIGCASHIDHSCKNTALGIELYTENRFVALTGTHATGDAETDHSDVLLGVGAKYFPPLVAANPAMWTDGPAENCTVIEDDDALIKKACSKKSAAAAFGDKASFKDLWTRNVEALGIAYPDEMREYDASSADAALAQHLMYWTAGDCGRVERLMWKSGLVRDKWKKHKNLLKGFTIPKAASLQTKYYGQSVEALPVDAPIPQDAVLKSGYQLLSVDGQLKHFTGCCYVQDVHRVFVPSGALLKPEQFNATYGGYHFQMETDGGGKTTKKAWEVFTESQAVQFPKAETTCFRPQLKPGELIEVDGRLLVNSYVPVVTPCIKGDVTPFLEHMAKLIPIESDRAILLAYMAAVVQYKGVKFQWCPLIQGMPGNGKTLFSKCLEFAIGHKYTSIPRADQIGEKYNSWLFDTLLICIEDIFVPGHRNEIIEILKPMITNDRLAKRAMQNDIIMQDVCSNFMINTNHRDAIHVSPEDRRFSIFYTAQQEVEDLARDGINGNYFPDIYNWLRKGGYAHVTEYLTTYPIPDALNPAGACHRAPATSSTQDAINESIGPLEQEILEVISEGRAGFRNGWVNSHSLDRVLDDVNTRYRMPRNKRRKLMLNLGYIWHPTLREGRASFEMIPGQGKPKLYIRKDHKHLNIYTPYDVVRAYESDQLSEIKSLTDIVGN